MCKAVTLALHRQEERGAGRTRSGLCIQAASLGSSTRASTAAGERHGRSHPAPSSRSIMPVDQASGKYLKPLPFSTQSVHAPLRLVQPGSMQKASANIACLCSRMM